MNYEFDEKIFDLMNATTKNRVSSLELLCRTISSLLVIHPLGQVRILYVCCGFCEYFQLLSKNWATFYPNKVRKTVLLSLKKKKKKKKKKSSKVK